MSLPELLLLLALIGLLLGPVLYKWTSRSAALRSSMDGFTVVVIAGLALLELAPNALSGGGALSLVFLAAGFALPMWLHRIGDLGQFSDRILVFFLTLHTAVESAALATADAPSAEALGLAIVAHQLPVGLAAFSLAPSAKLGWLSVSIIAIGMVFGFAAGEAAASAMSSTQGAWLQAMAAGSLLHVLSGHEEPPAGSRDASGADRGNGHAHGHSHTHSHGHAHARPAPREFGAGAFSFESGVELKPFANPTMKLPEANQVGRTTETRLDSGWGTEEALRRPASGAPSFFSALTQSSHETRAAFSGGLLGCLLVVATFLQGHGPEHHEGEFFHAVVDLALESAPAILLGYLGAGLLLFVLRERGVRSLAAPSRLSQALGGAAYGLSLPICSCGILPVFSSLVRRGAPPAASFAFLIATPAIGIDAALISLSLLGPELTIARLSAAAAMALATSWLIARYASKPAMAQPETDETTSRPTLGSALEFGFVDLFDHTMPWILFGLLLAGLLGPVLSEQDLTQFSPWLQVPLFALLGLPLYVCASGATPIAAVGIAHTISPGAAIAFLLTGPATNVTSFATIQRHYGRMVAILFGGAVFTFSVTSGYVTNLLLPSVASPMPAEHEHGHNLLTLMALAVLAILIALSALRQGPRGLLRQLRPSLSE